MKMISLRLAFGMLIEVLPGAKQRSDQFPAPKCIPVSDPKANRSKINVLRLAVGALIEVLFGAEQRSD